MMKKLFLVIFIIFVSFGIWYLSSNDNLDEQETYFRNIYALIKDIDFDIAKIEDSKILLYNSDDELVDEIIFNEYNKKIPLIHIKKQDSVIYFVTSLVVDDEIGIIFVNDDSDKIMDGIKSLKRVGGNSYQYDTAE